MPYGRTTIPFNIGSVLAVATQQHNAAANYLAMGFLTDSAKTLSKVKAYCTAVLGTLGASDLVCEIWADNDGPNSGSVLATSSTVTATPTGAAWVEFTGFSLALSAQTQYWIVIRNANGTPASNAPTWRYYNGGGTGIIGHLCGTAGTRWGWQPAVSTNSGTSWTYFGGGLPALRLEFNDASFDGFPYQNQSNVTAATSGVYSAREVGSLYTSPSMAMNVIGVVMPCAKTGTPTGDGRFRIYNGTTLLATTGVIVKSTNRLSSNAVYLGFFTSPVVVPASSTIRVVLGESTQSDTSSNAYIPPELTIENDANSRALMPFGNLQKTYFDGSSWTDTNTTYIPFTLLLDPNTPFPAASGGGGPLVGPGRMIRA